MFQSINFDLAPIRLSPGKTISNSICLFLLIFFLGMPAQAQILTTIAVVGGGSVAIDRAGREFRDSVDHASAAASALIGIADLAAKRRLEQIDEILNKTVGGLIGQSEEAMLGILAQAKRDIDSLREDIFLDVRRAIWDAECAGRRLLVSDLGTALGRLGNALGTNQIELTPPVRVLETPAWYSGCLWWCKNPYVVDVMSPFGQTYVRVKELMEQAIATELITEDTSAHNLVGTYEYLSSFARMSSCFYQGSEDRYNRESIQYREKARLWNNIINVELR